MKKTITICLLTMYSLSSYSQDVTLTKGETIAYLNRKLKELDGLIYFDQIRNVKIVNCALEFINDKIEISISKEHVDGGYKSNRISKFDPLYMTTIKKVNVIPFGKGSGQIQMWTSVPGSERLYENNKESYIKNDSVFVFYYVDGNNNDQKIIKAFLHLQALLKAEDDPFGN